MTICGRKKSDRKSRDTNESSVMPKFSCNLISLSTHRTKKKRQLKKTQAVHVLEKVNGKGRVSLLFVSTVLKLFYLVYVVQNACEAGNKAN